MYSRSAQLPDDFDDTQSLVLQAVPGVRKQPTVDVHRQARFQVDPTFVDVRSSFAFAANAEDLQRSDDLERVWVVQREDIQVVHPEARGSEGPCSCLRSHATDFAQQRRVL